MASSSSAGPKGQCRCRGQKGSNGNSRNVGSDKIRRESLVSSLLEEKPHHKETLNQVLSPLAAERASPPCDYCYPQQLGSVTTAVHSQLGLVTAVLYTPNLPESILQSLLFWIIMAAVLLLVSYDEKLLLYVLNNQIHVNVYLRLLPPGDVQQSLARL